MITWPHGILPEKAATAHSVFLSIEQIIMEYNSYTIFILRITSTVVSTYLFVSLVGDSLCALEFLTSQ